MKITKFNEKAIYPAKSHELDCGLDMFLMEDLTISPFETVCVDTGIGFEIPEGFAGIFVPRSSISKKGIIIQTSIVDPGYTGETHLIATNCSTKQYHFKQGDRLGSLVCFNILNPTINPDNNRGDNGLGSSGK